MTLGPSQSLRLFTVGYRWTRSCLSLESSQHIYKFLSKRPYLVRQDNNMYLGPVVAAQQVLDPSPQNCHPRKEKKCVCVCVCVCVGGGGGHICYNQVFRSLIPGSRCRLPHQGVSGKVFIFFTFFSFSFNCIMY